MPRPFTFSVKADTTEAGFSPSLSITTKEPIPSFSLASKALQFVASELPAYEAARFKESVLLSFAKAYPDWKVDKLVASARVRHNTFFETIPVLLL